jgi:peptidoglycan/xylan/chitin deacetylase (PgdA/CDA1 family)
MVTAWLFAIVLAFVGGNWLGVTAAGPAPMSADGGRGRLAITSKQDRANHGPVRRSQPLATPSGAPSPSLAGPSVAGPAASTLPASPPPPQGLPAEALTPPPDQTVPEAYGARILTGTPDVALTFDDGPDPTWTPEVLDLLRANGTTATFCLIGINAEAHPDLVRRIVAEGHTLCNHSWEHDLNLAGYPAEKIRADLERTNNAIHAAVPGAPIQYFRQPGGAWRPRVVEVAGELGMVSLHWDVDPQDWNLPGSTAIINLVSGEVRPGSIVLMHDGGGDRSGTVAACEKLLPYLRSRFRLTSTPAPALNVPAQSRYQVPD